MTDRSQYGTTFARGQYGSAFGHATHGHAGDVVGAIVSRSLDVLRRQAEAAADELPARVIGVVRDGSNRWQLKQFRSADDADDWFGQVTRDPAVFTYAAYFDKADVLYPRPLNEKVGAAAAASGSPALRVVSGHLVGTFVGADAASDPAIPASSTTDAHSPTSTSTEVRSPTSTSTEVRSPTSTSTEVRSPTSTSTDAYTQGNVTVTGGAGNGATIVHIHAPHPDQPTRADHEAHLERSRGSAWRAERQMGATGAPRPVMPMPAIVDATNAPRAASPIPDVMQALATAEGAVADRALDVLRRQATAAADELPARVIGTVRDGSGRWQLKQFQSADEADDWFGRATRDPAGYTYAAYFDKSDATYPDPLNEQIGTARAAAAPGAPIRRGIAEAA